jgi:hypothetical protein
LLQALTVCGDGPGVVPVGVVGIVQVLFCRNGLCDGADVGEELVVDGQGGVFSQLCGKVGFYFPLSGFWMNMINAGNTS